MLPPIIAIRSWPRNSRLRWCGANCTAVLGLLGFLVGELPAQSAPPGYTARILDGAVFSERVRSQVRTQAGFGSREESVGRNAEWRLVVDSVGPPLWITAWYDSLALWRSGPEGRITPDPDGIIGGWFKGVITESGIVTLKVLPFVPAEIAEVSDLSTAFATLLPRLPGRALPVGGTWQDSTGLRIFRRPDSLAGSRRLERYRWDQERTDTTYQTESDSLTFTVMTDAQESGELVWDSEWGPVAWKRSTATEITIPAAGSVLRPARSRVVEEVVVSRRLSPGGSG